MIGGRGTGMGKRSLLGRLLCLVGRHDKPKSYWGLEHWTCVRPDCGNLS